MFSALIISSFLKRCPTPNHRQYFTLFLSPDILNRYWGTLDPKFQIWVHHSPVATEFTCGSCVIWNTSALQEWLLDHHPSTGTILALPRHLLFLLLSIFLKCLKDTLHTTVRSACFNHQFAKKGCFLPVKLCSLWHFCRHFLLVIRNQNLFFAKLSAMTVVFLLCDTVICTAVF